MQELQMLSKLLRALVDLLQVLFSKAEFPILGVWKQVHNEDVWIVIKQVLHMSLET